MQVLLALDPFFHNWHSPQRKAWLGVQPYINGTPDEVANWIKQDDNIHTGTNTQFKVAEPGLINTNSIPVPLPSKLTIRLDMFDDSNALIHSVNIDRQTHCKLKRPEQFRELNGFSSKESVGKSLDSKVDEHSSYPYVFASTLKKSLLPKVSEEDLDPVLPIQMAESLLQKLELGQRQLYDDSCFENMGTPFDVTRDTDTVILRKDDCSEPEPKEDKILATNTHYLLGQLLDLGNDIELLKRIKYFKLYLDGTEVPLDDPKSTTQKIFSSVSEQVDYQDFEQSLTWSESFSKRINAKAQGDNFSTSLITPLHRFLWRLGARDQSNSGEDSFSNSVRWQAFERLDIREKAEVDNSLLSDPNLKTITFTPAIVLDVSLVRYRKTPDVMEDTSGMFPVNSMVVALRPNAAAKTQFEILLEHEGLIKSAKFCTADVETKNDSGDVVNIDYQLTPAEIELMQFPWSSSKEVLLFFDTVQGKATRGFPGNVPYQFQQHVYQKVLMVIELNAEIKLQRKGIDATGNKERDNPFGPRWEYWSTDIPSLPDFNALMSKQLDQMDFDQDQFIITAFHHDKYDYELAQSARRLESVVKVDFKNIRETDKDDEESFDFHQTVIEDKTNHNQLNVYEKRIDYCKDKNGIKRFERLIQRNNGSSLPSIKEINEPIPDTLKKNLSYAFMGVMKDSTSAQQEVSDPILQEQCTAQIGRKNVSPRDFYIDVYENIGDGREITIELEHTYGSVIERTTLEAVPNCIDEPILMTTDVAYAKIEDDGTTSRMRLLEVTLSIEEGIEVATLHVNQVLLETEWAKRHTDPSERPTEDETARSLAHIQAWQAFAEMYYSESVNLVAECYKFDIHKVSISEPDLAIQQGLVKEEHTLFEAKALLKDLCEKVFTDFDHVPERISVPTGQRWSEDFNAIRFRIDVQRKESMLPNADPNYWEVHTRLLKEQPGGVEALYTLDGATTTQLDSQDIKTQITQYLLQLKCRGGYLHPKGIENVDVKERNQQYFALLGEGKTPPNTSPNNNAWIVPAQIKRLEGAVDVAYCPIGILPVAQDAYLRSQTSETMRRYFEALQSIIDFEQYTWFKSSANELVESVKKLTGESLYAAYDDLIESAVGKFKAIPDDNAPFDKLVASVRTLSRESQEHENGIGLALRNSLLDMITREPALFGTLKGLGLVDALSADNGDIRTDMFNLFMRKAIDENTNAEGSLTSSHLLSKQKRRMTYLEQLDDSQYDNGFTLTSLRGETAERVFEQQPVGVSDEAFHINTPNNRVFVPERQPGAIGQAEVRLVSRRPVKDPNPGSVSQTSLLDQVSLSDLQTEHVTLSSLLSAQIQFAEDAAPKNMLSQIASPATFSGKLDNVVVSAIFQIAGDEESNNIGLNDEFSNDAFFVLVTDESIDNVPQNTTTVPAGFKELVNDLQSTRPFALQETLVDNVLNINNMDYCKDVLSTAPNRNSMPDISFRQKAFFIRSDQASDKLKVVDSSGDLAPEAQYQCGVWLFKNEAGDTVVWVEVELPIWHSKHISLVQTRNQAGLGDNQQEIFAPEFATISRPMGEPMARMTNTKILRDQFNRESTSPDFIELDNVVKTPMDFVHSVLGKGIDNVDVNFPGKDNILSIVVKEDGSCAFPSNQLESSSFDVFNGTCAIYTYSIQNMGSDSDDFWSGNESKRRWFGDANSEGRWRIDFTWIDPQTNDEILRILDVPVYLSP
ncbi:hypothetical protein [Pseudoalteromonas piscicida]|uniref:hypothetical protein n=1 Tax=Pseudoalteromonas piscicida TaxID=43662 RepID=UPI0005FA7DFE|nr:hypothetical protein [Pseudoalteromonas piscicida]KJY96245.1 hypothetical protein TW73_16305 [Pseudoalteromonas piscicida]